MCLWATHLTSLVLPSHLEGKPTKLWIIPISRAGRIKPDQAGETLTGGLTPRFIYINLFPPPFLLPLHPPPLQAPPGLRAALEGLGRARGEEGPAFRVPRVGSAGRKAAGWGAPRSLGVCPASPGLNNRAPLLFVGSKVVRYA